LIKIEPPVLSTIKIETINIPKNFTGATDYNNFTNAAITAAANYASLNNGNR